MDGHHPAKDPGIPVYMLPISQLLKNKQDPSSISELSQIHRTAPYSVRAKDHIYNDNQSQLYITNHNTPQIDHGFLTRPAPSVPGMAQRHVPVPPRPRQRHVPPRPVAAAHAGVGRKLGGEVRGPIQGGRPDLPTVSDLGVRTLFSIEVPSFW